MPELASHLSWLWSSSPPIPAPLGVATTVQGGSNHGRCRQGYRSSLLLMLLQLLVAWPPGHGLWLGRQAMVAHVTLL